jgi:hypothetical protein
MPGRSRTIPSKTVEMIIYISSRLRDKPTYGSTLLGKALCLIDSMSFLEKGKPITDLSYIKQDFGPTPEPAKYLKIREQLLLAGELEKIETDYFGRTQIKYVANREPDINLFEKEELALINDVLDSISDVSATEISDYTHNFISWIFAEPKEQLPFYTFLLSSKDPELKDYRWAEKSLKLYNKDKND